MPPEVAAELLRFAPFLELEGVVVGIARRLQVQNDKFRYMLKITSWFTLQAVEKTQTDLFLVVESLH